MTVRRKKDLDRIQTYIKKLQEIKFFLEQAHYEEKGIGDFELRVKTYWAD